MARTGRPEVVALLAEAKARPSDDTPRLILADFLENSPLASDQLRGEFVRLQCELDRKPAHDPRCSSLSQRLDQILTENQRAWVEPIVEANFLQEWEWQRGLLWIRPLKLRLDKKAPQALCGTEAFAWVEGVYLRGPTDLILRCLQLPLLESVPQLNLRSSPLFYAGLRALADSPGLAHLNSIDLCSCHISAGTRRSLDGHSNEVALAALLGSPHLGPLVGLGLADNGLSGDDLTALASTRKLPHLQHLDLSANAVRTKQLIYLLENPALSRLTSLRLSRCRGTDSERRQDDWDAVASCPALSRLSSLDLSHGTLPASAIRALASSPYLGRLTFLDLSGTDPNHAGDLVHTPSLSRLRELRLDWDEVWPGDHRVLRGRFGSAVPLPAEASTR